MPTQLNLKDGLKAYGTRDDEAIETTTHT